MKGLQNLIESYLQNNFEEKLVQSIINADNPNQNKEETIFFENLYSIIGHYSYTKILKLFEKYCMFGKTITNYTMEYSQFCSLFSQNKLYEKTLPKSDLEVIYNRVKQNTIIKNVSFYEFLQILKEIGKYIYKWEKDDLERLKNLINNSFCSIVTLNKNEQEKKYERIYYFLETEEVISIIKPFLNTLFIYFEKNSETRKHLMNIEMLMNIAQKKKIVPVFLSNKEIVDALNFINSEKKNFIPKNQIDFRTFVELICLLSIVCSDKYIQEGGEIYGITNDSQIGYNEDTKSGRKKTSKISKRKINLTDKLKFFLEFICLK